MNATPDGLLCHCDVDPIGHAPGTLDCPTVVKAGAYRRSTTGSVVSGHGIAATHQARTATGTCPDCGRRGVRVKRVEIRGHLPGQERRRAQGYQGGLLGLIPALMPHRTPGRRRRDCGGAGKVPAEIHYRMSPLVTAHVQEFGLGYVEAPGALLELPGAPAAPKSNSTPDCAEHWQRVRPRLQGSQT
ncbi:hypothetical protein K1T35_47600 (plasmid) [Pseudonocardia sp. DSM 110487]|uniref:hypothetical protein n=1 Tax=Pseudonocardia sp. DSM 110487 TaxID=2865833 RepID=UPI001C69775E|nr:hypothetical protein [Pseudonocardia sp. DSM 110487]QYN41016.1 hypothetical protein K1T35_47600 [Pseudonocardia sp. DSM 110487]